MLSKIFGAYCTVEIKNLDGSADVILTDPRGKTYRIPASVVGTDGVKNVNY